MKNKIYKYDFLIVGAGLIGSLAAISLHQRNFKILVIEKNRYPRKDERTLAVNANSRDFLKKLGLWGKIKDEYENIEKIIIKDFINKNNLIFQNENESMGSVVFNSKILKIARDYLIKNKLLLTGIDIELINLKQTSNITINKKKFSFKKIILSVGRDYFNKENIIRTQFGSNHRSYVGFFEHQNNHSQIAYEIFTPKGPLAVLPSPSLNHNNSTFIYSTEDSMNLNSLSNLIRKNFQKSHGNILLKNTISNFPIKPHLSRPIQKDILLIGDTAHSIHPVAGQGWNLGVKDIQVLCKQLDSYHLDHLNFDNLYFSNRIIENLSYLTFTSILNCLYEYQTPISKSLVKGGFSILNHITPLRELFINLAMGKNKLV